MPWGRNPLRNTKPKGTNSSSGSSEANWAKPGEVFNLPPPALPQASAARHSGKRTLDTCTDCQTLPIHTHFQGRGRFWHETHVKALSITLSPEAAFPQTQNRSSSLSVELQAQTTFPAQEFMHGVLQLLLSQRRLLLASMQMHSPITHIWQVYDIWKSRLKAGIRQNQTIHA